MDCHSFFETDINKIGDPDFQRKFQGQFQGQFRGQFLGQFQGQFWGQFCNICQLIHITYLVDPGPGLLVKVPIF